MFSTCYIYPFIALHVLPPISSCTSSYLFMCKSAPLHVQTDTSVMIAKWCNGTRYKVKGAGYKVQGANGKAMK